MHLLHDLHLDLDVIIAQQQNEPGSLFSVNSLEGDWSTHVPWGSSPTPSKGTETSPNSEKDRPTYSQSIVLRVTGKRTYLSSPSQRATSHIRGPESASLASPSKHRSQIQGILDEPRDDKPRPRLSMQTTETRYHSPVPNLLMFVPLDSSPSEQATGEYLSRGPRKGRHWA